MGFEKRNHKIKFKSNSSQINIYRKLREKCQKFSATYEEVFKGLNYLEQQMKKKDLIIQKLKSKLKETKQKNKILEKRFMELPLEDKDI